MSLSGEQVVALLRPINKPRGLRDNKGMSHVSQQDIRAHLTRIFGFGGWSSAVTDLTLVREAHAIKNGKETDGWAVTYRATVRLDLRDPAGQPLASYEDVATGTSPNLPTLGDAHDFACKVAVSMALKRAATNLGDGFGLSLYNKGQTSPLVIATLVMPTGEGRDASDEVPEQVAMGHDDAGSAEPRELPTTAVAFLAKHPDVHPGLDVLGAEVLEATTDEELLAVWNRARHLDGPGGMALRDLIKNRKEVLAQDAAEVPNMFDVEPAEPDAWADVEVVKPGSKAKK